MKNLEEKITSIDVVSISILMYMVGYFIKMTAFFTDLFMEVIPLYSVRLMASGFIAFSVAQILMSVSVNMQNRVIAYVLSFLDAVLLMFLLNAFTSELPVLIRVKRIFISLFLSFIFFLSIEVFKLKKTQKEASKTQKEESKAQKEASQEQKLARTCKHCQREFKSVNGLNAHVKSCKEKLN